MISDRNFPLKTLEMGFQRIDTSKLYLGAFPRNSLEALAFGDCLFRRWTKAIPISHPQKVGQSGSRNSAFVFFFWVIELYSNVSVLNEWFLFFVDFSTLKTISNQILSEKGNLVQHSPTPSITLLKSMQPWDSLKRVQSIVIQPCFVSWRLDSMTRWTGP